MELLFWTIFLSISGCDGRLILEESEFRLQSHEPRSKVKHSEELTFSFNIQLNVSSEMNKMEMSINGSDLKTLDAANLKKTEFVWKDGDGKVEYTNEPQSIDETEQASVETGYPAEISVDVKRGKWTLDGFRGSIVMFVPDSAKLGSLLRPLMYVSFYMQNPTPITDCILAEYTFVELPKIEVYAGKPLQIDMKEKSKFTSKIRLPSGPMGDSLLIVYMPNNVTMSNDATNLYIEEPFLSVTDFQVTGSKGFTEDSAAKISRADSDYISNSKSSENDAVTVSIPQVELKDAVGEIDFMAEAEMLDFDGAAENTEMMTCYVLKVADFFIIKNTSLFTEIRHDVERMPNLTVSMDHVGTYHEGTKILLQLGLDHEPKSWGSAYNISWMWYLPLFIGGNFNVGKVTDLLKKSKKTYTFRGTNVLAFEVKRASFVHHIRVSINFTVDTEHVLFEPGEEFVILSETVYNSWRGLDEMGLIEQFPIKIGKKIGKKTKQDGRTLCQCSDDGLATCRCSKDNACKHDRKGITCVNCTTPWECVRTLPDYGKESSLHDREGNIYMCDRAVRNRQSWEMVACIKQNKDKTVKELGLTLGTLLGKTAGSLDLYGISRNGLAYVLSNDDGVKWYTVNPSVYAKVSAHMDFIHTVLA